MRLWHSFCPGSSEQWLREIETNGTIKEERGKMKEERMKEEKRRRGMVRNENKMKGEKLMFIRM